MAAKHAAAEHAANYTAYQERVRDRLGPVEVGVYGKWDGRLIKVLDADEFIRRYAEYQHLRHSYQQIMASGDTVNDAIMQLLVESSIELLLTLDD
ncbi:MAG: hypothetical protein JRH20_12815 [Deltaproteobacteria bacterium]|nr:hypothetical protein [Deltaproteobacteria bacterium]